MKSNAEQYQAMTKVGPKVTASTKETLARLWRTTNAGAQWVLGSFPGLYSRTMRELKGCFSKDELGLMLDAAEHIVFYPEVAGQFFQFSLMNSMSRPTLEANYEAIDFDELVERIRNLTAYQRAVLEVWAQAYGHTDGDVSRGEYIGQLT